MAFIYIATPVLYSFIGTQFLISNQYVQGTFYCHVSSLITGTHFSSMSILFPQLCVERNFNMWFSIFNTSLYNSQQTANKHFWVLMWVLLNWRGGSFGVRKYRAIRWRGENPYYNINVNCERQHQDSRNSAFKRRESWSVYFKWIVETPVETASQVLIENRFCVSSPVCCVSSCSLLA